MSDQSGLTRRAFVPAAAAMIVPRSVLGGPKFKAPSDKLNIAAVGIGGMGAYYVKGCESENIVALCDVDDSFAAKTFVKYPAAKTYRDYRVMLEKEKNIDAVIVGTPDHTHALITVAALQLGKHVYCAKPLTHTVGEARAVAKAAREAGVATQMSVQSCASDAACTTAEWVQAGAVGPVREVQIWIDRPWWPQGIRRPTETPRVPKGLNWDLWLGPAPARPYHPAYLPFRWRGWVDFGCGALGDMACHTFHMIFQALNLGYPTTVQASSSTAIEPDPEDKRFHARKVEHPETFPLSSIVTWDFPARGDQPPVRMSWYEGWLKPPRPAGCAPDLKLPDAGVFFIGDKGVLFSGFSGGPRLIPENPAFTPPPKTLPRTIGHYVEWIQAAKGGSAAHCNFEFGSLLTEVALLGVAATRTGRQLSWDAGAMQFRNDAEANALINPPYRAGWSL